MNPTQNNPDTLNVTDVTNGQNFKLPQVQSAGDQLTGFLTASNNQLTQAQTAEQQAKAKLDTNMSSYDSLLNQLTQQTPETVALQEAQGLPALQSKQKDLQALSQRQFAQYLQGITQAEQQPIANQFIANQQREISRQHGIESLLTNALISANEGQIATAQATVDRAIAAKYDPIKQQAQNKLDFIKLNYDELSSAQKKVADAQSTKLNLQIKKYEKQQADETAIEKMIVEASPNAPANIIANAKAIKDKGGSALEVAQALGKYGGDYLKTELLKQQIETEKAQRANYNASAAKTRAETGLLGQPLGVDGVIAILPKSQQERYYKLQGDFDAATKNYRGAIDSAGSITALSKDATPQQQTAIIFQYMKTLDPSSTVREGEFALVGKTAGLGDRAVNALRKLDNGSRLNEKQINDIVGATKILAENAKKNLELTSNEYDRRAVKFGLPKGLFYEKQDVVNPTENKFGQAIGVQTPTNYSTAGMSVSPDGSLNFTLPTNQPKK